ncbi:peptidylprolyl isomerase [bacterium]|nr:peptidylprolyl isomerase [bacterium]MBU1652034.1 peptidylprolyl isomerase [bacterium]MBU1881228.1 peptidylprolyl isomerase [bacterium]
MAAAKNGDQVKVHYVGKLQDGTIFDSSENRDPLQFKLGEKEVIPGFEEAVVGMEAGEKKTVTIPEDEAYGPQLEDLVATFDRDQFPGDVELELGQQLEIPREDGQKLLVRVSELSEDAVTLDANHPLAGQDLTFEIELVETA